jgi:hypothetical protein
MVELGQEWKEDPGIKFLCYYHRGGPNYAHHTLFEVDDVNTFTEKMDSPFFEANFPYEEFHWELVRGNTEVDEFWRS